MRIYVPGGSPKYNRVGIFADPKSGKTRLATSLPWGECRFGDKAVYVASDELSEELDAVHPEDRKHILVVKPGPEDPKDKTYDPYLEACAIATRQFEWEDGSPIDTMIWDTMTATSRSVLNFFSLQGRFASEGKQITYGKPGDPSHLAFPTQGDYGAAQNAILHVLNLLFRHQKNIIILFHAGWVVPKKETMMVGGPSTVGGALIQVIAGLFPSVIRLVCERKTFKDQVTERFVAHNSAHGPWLAGVRGAYSYMPDQVLEQPHPTAFWRAWHEHREKV